MDLQDLIPSEETLVVELTYKDKALTNNDGSPMTVEVYLPHTKEFKKVVYAQQSKYLTNQKTSKDIDVEEMVADNIERCVAITKSWNITFKGEQPKFTSKKAKDIYETLDFIPALIQKKLGEQEDFT